LDRIADAKAVPCRAAATDVMGQVRKLLIATPRVIRAQVNAKQNELMS
jgi:hypothetical protein